MVEPELSVQSHPATNETDDQAARGDLILDDHFAPVPEWVLDSEISDCALRLYAVLLRFGQTSGARMPSRAALARRLHKGSTDTVDRAMRELVAIGAVAVERRRSMGVYLTNRYHLRTRGRETETDGRSEAATNESPGTAGVNSMPIDARVSVVT